MSGYDMRRIALKPLRLALAGWRVNAPGQGSGGGGEC
jgi:hypothetical protein